MNKSIIKWEFWGAIIIIVLGFVFHFAFSWLGQWRPSAFFLAVNESVWEHCKIGFWPALFYSILEFPFIKNKSNNFFTAKSAQLLIIPFLIITMFYTYTGVIGYNILFIDIGIFVLSVLLSQYVSYKLLTRELLPKYYTYISFSVLFILLLAFSTLTFSPGSIPLFKDSKLGIYGIPKI